MVGGQGAAEAEGDPGDGREGGDGGEGRCRYASARAHAEEEEYGARAHAKDDEARAHAETAAAEERTPASYRTRRELQTWDCDAPTKVRCGQ